MIFNENDPYFVHPPQGIQARSIDVLLQDATIKALKLDPTTGDCTLSVTISFTSKHHGLPEDTLYSIVFERANRLIALTASEKPNAAHDESRTEQGSDERRIAWNARYRTESVGWPDFEQRIVTEGDGDIYSAEVLSTEETVSLQISMNLAGGTEWYEVSLAASSLRCERSDGWVGSLEDFVKMGVAYWEAWGNKANRAPSATPEP